MPNRSSAPARKFLAAFRGVVGATLAPAFALSLALVMTPAVSGQSMAVSFQDPSTNFKPSITARELGMIARVLQLTPAEQESLDALRDGYEAALRVRREYISEAIGERVELAQATGDLSVAQVETDESKKYEEEAGKLHKAFLEDLKSLLTREQADRWPLVERELRRFRSIGKGRLAGESVDLVRVVDDGFSEAWANKAAAEVLLAYAVAIDGALLRRDAACSPEKQTEFSKLVGENRDAALRLWEEAQAARIELRDLNLRFAARLAATLPEETGERLNRRVFELSYPSLVKPSRSETTIRGAAGLETLDARQRTAITEVVNLYEKRRWGILLEMADVYREKQLQQRPPSLDPTRSVGKVATTADGEVISFYDTESLKPKPDDPLVKLREKKLELDREFRRRVFAELTEEQRSAVRKPVDTMIILDADVVWGL